MATTTYTSEERLAALAKLPKPIKDFARSNTITQIYMGLAKKHKLNIREISLLSELANLALLGLEPESSVEPGIHQILPEIPNAVARELVADINDRIFKEANRRLRENVIEPEFADEGKEETTPVPISDDELDKRAAEEEKNGGFVPPDDEEAPVVAVPAEAASQGAPAPEQMKDVAVPALGVAERKLAQTVSAKPMGIVVEQKSVPPATTPAAEPEKKALPKIDPYREQI